VNEAAAVPIPYERQQDNRSCGPACLSMVYRSLGLECTQPELWAHVGREDGFGRPSARTHLVCQDALRRGFAALVIQARDPWRLLRECPRHRARAILNQQLYPGGTRRHFAVLLHAGEDHVLVHDPWSGPDQRLRRDAYLRLWGPYPDDSPVAGHVLVAVAPGDAPPAACAACGTALPGATACPACRLTVPLRPGGLLGCADRACPAATWQRLFCPYCDNDLTDLRAAPAGPPPLPGDLPPVPEREESPMNLANDIKALSGKFTEYQAALAEAHAAAPDGPARDQLQALLQQMQQTHAQLVQEMEKQDQHMSQATKDAMARITAAKARVAEAAREREAAAARAAKKAPRPEKDVDPELSKKLSDELLAAFGNRPEPGPADNDRDLWDWVQQPGAEGQGAAGRGAER